MFGRMSFIHGDPSRVDELIEFVTWTVKPATDSLAGNLGLGMWVDRSSGAALVLSVWKDEASMVASETAVTALRDDGAAVIRGVAIVERYETLLTDMAMPHQAGNVMRMIRMAWDPSDIERHTAWSRDTIVPVLRRVPGYLSYVVAAHRGTGRAVAMSTYRDGTDADIAYAATAPIRTAAVNRGITIDGVQQYEVALVGIRATPSLPTQRTIELPTETPV
jgi:quinol monooxygenase YgiN